jgi:hypothetical protein
MARTSIRPNGYALTMQTAIVTSILTVKDKSHFFRSIPTSNMQV